MILELSALMLLIEPLATKYGVDPLLVARIVEVESSRQVAAYNPATRDIGLMQVNETTAASMGLDYQRLLVDAQYNLESGIRVLAYMQRRFKSREPMSWVCRYNVGTGQLVGRRLHNCIQYLKKIYGLDYVYGQ